MKTFQLVLECGRQIENHDVTSKFFMEKYLEEIISCVKWSVKGFREQGGMSRFLFLDHSDIE